MLFISGHSTTSNMTVICHKARLTSANSNCDTIQGNQKGSGEFHHDLVSQQLKLLVCAKSVIKAYDGSPDAGTLLQYPTNSGDNCAALIFFHAMCL
jgi:hypothetical protein